MGQALANPCDVCAYPGHCCKGFAPNVVSWLDEGKAGMQEVLNDKGLPFVPEAPVPHQQLKEPETGREYGYWWFSCPHLDSTGRCGIYLNRPQLCKDFQPYSDQLCVMWRPPQDTIFKTVEAAEKV